MAKRTKETVECEGRFSDLRAFLYNNAFPLVLGERTLVNYSDLINVWELVHDEVVSRGFDYRDPYYNCNTGQEPGQSTDCLRRNPNIDFLSLVPLIESQLGLEDGLIDRYAISMNNSPTLSVNLERMGSHPDKYFRTVLGKEPKDIVFPGGRNLAGYKISANFGIGTICSGGLSGGGVRSDSPFIFEIYQEAQGRRGEYDLAAVVGFWAQDNAMLVSQMQPGRNASFPSEVPFGIGCLRTLESAAVTMGFKSVLVYSGRMHPVFRQYPDSGDAMKKEFTCVFDGSAKKLGYQGTRCSSYEKVFDNGSGKKGNGNNGGNH